VPGIARRPARTPTEAGYTTKMAGGHEGGALWRGGMSASLTCWVLLSPPHALEVTRTSSRRIAAPGIAMMILGEVIETKAGSKTG
jgi:hypothetical protein